MTADLSGRRSTLSPATFLAASAAIFLLLWSLSRILLLIPTAERWTGPMLPVLLRTGLRVDLIGVGLAMSLPVLLWPLMSHRATTRLWWFASRTWISLIAILALVLEIATPSFFLQYESRPNHLAVEYLREWDSVLPMLWTGFKVPLFGAIVVLSVGIWLALRWLSSAVPARPPYSALSLLAIWPILLAADVLLIRSSLDHRPANPALFARWSDHLLDQLALNSAYTFAYAVYAQRHERSAADVYGDLPDSDLLEVLRDDSRFASAPPQQPTWHRQEASRKARQARGLIIVVEESLGADFSERLGGQGLTPELDRWSTRGIWFRRLYATGTRSARGLEAIVAGFPPSPAPAVLKREGAQEGFATLASVLQQAGYRSRFIYGGGAHFDNMRSFFLGNGFDAVIEQRDFINPMHVGSWGVSDEDLFDRALAETDQAYAIGERFFHLVFTSSHHEPFDIPPGRLPPDIDKPGTPSAAVRYADFAVGAFLEKAVDRPWYGETLVMVVADHDVRVYGDDVIPTRRFQVPGLIVGADTEPRQIESLASQIDLAPTLLSLMGIDSQIPFPGRDLTRTLPEFGARHGPEPRAILQFDDRYAWLTPDELRVLFPGGTSRGWHVDPSGVVDSSPSPLTSSDHRELHVQALLGDWLYRRRAYSSKSVIVPPDASRPSAETSRSWQTDSMQIGRQVAPVLKAQPGAG